MLQTLNRIFISLIILLCETYLTSFIIIHLSSLLDILKNIQTNIHQYFLCMFYKFVNLNQQNIMLCHFTFYNVVNLIKV